MCHGCTHFILMRPTTIEDLQEKATRSTNAWQPLNIHLLQQTSLNLVWIVMVPTTFKEQAQALAHQAVGVALAAAAAQEFQALVVQVPVPVLFQASAPFQVHIAVLPAVGAAPALVAALS